MSGELVGRLMKDHVELMSFLRDRSEISFLATMESSLPKILLLASASDLEESMQQLIMDYFHSATNSSDFAVEFVRNKAVERQYHSYFDWPARSATKFFALFGDRFKARAKQAIASDDKLAISVKSFCEVGDLRNQLVHRNYAAFTVEKTASEVFDLYRDALYFLDRLPELLKGNTESGDP